MAEPDRTDAIKVLICDDAAGMRTLLEAVISLRAGIEAVGEAADGNEAVTQAGLLQPDVILLDLSMPHRTGLDALPDIKQAAPDAKIIILSGFAGSVVRSELITQGVAGYLEKGVGPDEILDAIEHAAAGRKVDSVLN